MAELSEEQRQLLERLRTAFADVPYPGDDRITELHFSTCGLPCQECADVREAFAGKHWRDFLERPYDLLGYFPPREPVTKIGRDFLPLMLPEALHFFIPVLLAAVVTDPQEADIMLDGIPSLLDPGPRPPLVRAEQELWERLRSEGVDLLGCITEEQRQAVTEAFRLARSPELWEWSHDRCRDILALMSEEQRLAVAEALRYIGRPFEEVTPPTYADAVGNLVAGAPVAWRRHGQ